PGLRLPASWHGRPEEVQCVVVGVGERHRRPAHRQGVEALLDHGRGVFEAVCAQRDVAAGQGRYVGRELHRPTLPGGAAGLTPISRLADPLNSYGRVQSRPPAPAPGPATGGRAAGRRRRARFAMKTVLFDIVLVLVFILISGYFVLAEMSLV